MKKIISLMLAVICMMSLILSGCDKQEIEPVTVGELLDLIKAEGYTNIQHEEGTCEYLLVDSGDLVDEDYNDIVICINTNYDNNSNDYVFSLRFEYNNYNDEIKHLTNILFLKLTNNSEFVDLVDNKLTGTEFFNTECRYGDGFEKGLFDVKFWDYGLEYSQENDVKRYFVFLYIDDLE